MTLKKVGVIVLLLAIIIGAIWLALHYYNTSKQVYEGILVYQEQLENGTIYYRV